MKITYIGPSDAMTVGRSTLERDGESVDIAELGLTKEAAEALVDRGDFKSGSYKAKVDSHLIPAEDFAPAPPSIIEPPAAASEKE